MQNVRIALRRAYIISSKNLKRRFFGYVSSEKVMTKAKKKKEFGDLAGS